MTCNVNSLLYFILLGSILGCAQSTSKGNEKLEIEYGENFVVFEAEVSEYSNLWKLRTPQDPEYEKFVNTETQSNIPPVNETYLEFVGPWKGAGDSSKIEYKFKCPKSGDYQLAMRLLQPLEKGEKGDAKNDVFVKLEGDFESGTEKFKTEDLTHKHKFWGRGVNEWGTAQYLEHHGNAIPIYTLKEGEEYTLTMYGRSTGACIDYILFFNTELKLGVKNLDLAAQNSDFYRPNGPNHLSDQVAKIVLDKSATYLSKPGESKILKFKVYPSMAKDKNINWSSSNEDIVTINKNGKMTAHAIGSAMITGKTSNGVIIESPVEVGKFIETFDDYRSDNLEPRKFMGDNGIEWTISALGTIRMNDTHSLLFKKDVTGLKSNSISGGISNFSVQCQHLFLEDKERTIELVINDKVVGSVSKATEEKYTFQVSDINVEGDFVLELHNVSKGDKKSYNVMIDNLIWQPFK